MTYIIGYEYTFKYESSDGHVSTHAVLGYHKNWEDFLSCQRRLLPGKVTPVSRKAIEYAHACDETKDVDELTRQSRAS